MILYVALVFVGIVSTAVLLWQYWRADMLTEAERRIRSLRPLSNGRKAR